MSLGDTINYILFTNPISHNASAAFFKTAEILTSQVEGIMPKEKTQIIKMDPEPLWKLACSSHYFIKLAGVSGAMAVALGAYGSHKILPNEKIDDQTKRMFETANRYHFFHTLALLGVPLAKYPTLTGSLIALGMTMFCGSVYYRTVTGDERIRRITPLGGSCLIIGWLTMAL